MPILGLGHLSNPEFGFISVTAQSTRCKSLPQTSRPLSSKRKDSEGAYYQILTRTPYTLEGV